MFTEHSLCVRVQWTQGRKRKTTSLPWGIQQDAPHRLFLDIYISAGTELQAIEMISNQEAQLLSIQVTTFFSADLKKNKTLKPSLKVCFQINGIFFFHPQFQLVSSENQADTQNVLCLRPSEKVLNQYFRSFPCGSYRFDNKTEKSF